MEASNLQLAQNLSEAVPHTADQLDVWKGNSGYSIVIKDTQGNLVKYQLNQQQAIALSGDILSLEYNMLSQ